MMICSECDAVIEMFDEDLGEGVCPNCGVVDLRDTDDDEAWDGFNSDAEADADVLASAGFGTDEDYGCFGGDDY